MSGPVNEGHLPAQTAAQSLGNDVKDVANHPLKSALWLGLRVLPFTYAAHGAASAATVVLVALRTFCSAALNPTSAVSIAKDSVRFVTSSTRSWNWMNGTGGSLLVGVGIGILGGLALRALHRVQPMPGLWDKAGELFFMAPASSVKTAYQAGLAAGRNGEVLKA